MGVCSLRRIAGPALLLLWFLVLPVPATPAAAFTPDALRARLATLGVPAYVEPGLRGREQWKSVHRFYELVTFRPAWVAGGRLTRPAETLLRAALQSDRDGMDNTGYARLAADARGVRRASASDWADPVLDLDIRVTYTLLRYADEMANGRVDPRGKTALWALYPERTDVVPVLVRARHDGLTDDVRAALVPPHPQYQALRRELERYRALARAGGWPQVDGGPMLKPGQRSPRVTALRARLRTGTDLPGVPETTEATATAPAETAPVYDPALVAAIKAFQARHGLKADGVLCKDTVAALNVTAEDRVRQIEVNLERWRWLPRRLGDRYLLINIPTFELEGFDHGNRTIQMRVVTGTAGETPTPVFAEAITHLVFSPYWNVPPGIAQEEVAPAAWHNRTYLARNNMEVLLGSRVVDPATVDLGNPRLQFRQRPGPGNSLGQVKFLLPNRFNVYLHDTPSRKLFAEQQRDYSHGCVRVHQPFELAQWVLQGTGWTAERIRAAMNAGAEEHVRLDRTVPVYIAYFTVWVDDDGTARFLPDVYRHDAAHLPLLPPVAPVEPAEPQVAGAGAATSGAVVAVAAGL